jgi:hypothetical protein
MNRTGIYQAFLMTFPGNEKIKKCIYEIVKNVKNNDFFDTELCISGPHCFSQFFTDDEIINLPFYFHEDGTQIYKKDRPFFEIYPEYRTEQREKYKKEKHKYYADLWKMKHIYHYPILKQMYKLSIKQEIRVKILKENVQLWNSNITVVPYYDESNDNKRQYLLNRRWINYKYHKDGYKILFSHQWKSLNTCCLLDENFNMINKEVFLKEDYERERKNIVMGVEDIRFFSWGEKNEYYYNASYYDGKENKMSTICGKMKYEPNKYELSRTIIKPITEMISVNKIEKNWSYCADRDNNVRLIHSWSPMKICKWSGTKLELVETRFTPSSFDEAHGGSAGYLYNDEWWFVLHYSQKFYENNLDYYRYQHFIAVLDRDLNVRRYTEPFTFEGSHVEFCLSIIVEPDRVIVPYSVLDTTSVIGVYSMNDIENSVRWWQMQ